MKSQAIDSLPGAKAVPPPGSCVPLAIIWSRLMFMSTPCGISGGGRHENAETWLLKSTEGGAPPDEAGPTTLLLLPPPAPSVSRP